MSGLIEVYGLTGDFGSVAPWFFAADVMSAWPERVSVSSSRLMPIWELDNRLWTHSRLACVAGLRAVAALPSTGTGSGDCAALADAIMAETARTSAHPDGYWQRTPDDDRPDAALLLPPVRGAMPDADPRTVATLRVVRDQLVREEYVFRFRHDQRPLGDPEGAFLLCRFTMALVPRTGAGPGRGLSRRAEQSTLR